MAVEWAGFKGGRNPRCREHHVFARTPALLSRASAGLIALDDLNVHNKHFLSY